LLEPLLELPLLLQQPPLPVVPNASVEAGDIENATPATRANVNAPIANRFVMRFI
jgi:hypothetical protein